MNQTTYPSQKTKNMNLFFALALCVLMPTCSMSEIVTDTSTLPSDGNSVPFVTEGNLYGPFSNYYHNPNIPYTTNDLYVYANLGEGMHSMHSATLPNGDKVQLPPSVFASELPFAASLAGGNPRTFSSIAASLSSNAELSGAVRQQALLRTQLGHRITHQEKEALERERVVAAAAFQLQVASRALALAQRDAAFARSALATSNRQLAALDVNGLRLADGARLADLRRGLALVDASLAPGAILTETQRVTNTQLAAGLRDEIARVTARMNAASVQIDKILSTNITNAAASLYAKAQGAEKRANDFATEALQHRTLANKINNVRAFVLASEAHTAIEKAGVNALATANTKATSSTPVLSKPVQVASSTSSKNAHSAAPAHDAHSAAPAHDAHSAAPAHASSPDQHRFREMSLNELSENLDHIISQVQDKLATTSPSEKNDEKIDVVNEDEKANVNGRTSSKSKLRREHQKRKVGTILEGNKKQTVKSALKVDSSLHSTVEAADKLLASISEDTRLHRDDLVDKE